VRARSGPSFLNAIAAPLSRQPLGALVSMEGGI